MEWRTIEEFPKYEVNKFGVVRNKETKEIIKIRDNRNRNVVSLIDVNGKLHTKVLVHRLVAKAFLGVEDRQHVYAIDGDLRNTHVSNLTIDYSLAAPRKRPLVETSPKFARQKYQTVNIETGEVIETYSSLDLATRDLHLSHGSMKVTNERLKKRNSSIRVERISEKSKQHVEEVWRKVKRVVDYLDENYTPEGEHKFNPALVDEGDETLLQLQQEMNEAMYE